MNYEEDLKRNLTQRATIVNVFKQQLMEEKGLMTNVVLPPFQGSFRMD